MPNLHVDSAVLQNDGTTIVVQGTAANLVTCELLPPGMVLTRQSRKRKTEAKMAFIRQNGWLSQQPAWGECHGYSMAVLDQVRQPHRLHPPLF